MIHSSRFSALLDANVLYPAPLRDFLLRLAAQGLYKPKWTVRIQEEWIKNPLKDRPDLKEGQLQQTKDAMNSAFPDANIIDYEELIDGLSLPDKEDKHVLAAGIKAGVDVIVTFNLSDFPPIALSKYGIESQHPDFFGVNMIELNPEKAQKAIDSIVHALKNPPKTRAEILDKLVECGLKKSVALLS